MKKILKGQCLTTVITASIFLSGFFVSQAQADSYIRSPSGDTITTPVTISYSSDNDVCADYDGWTIVIDNLTKGGYETPDIWTVSADWLPPSTHSVTYTFSEVTGLGVGDQVAVVDLACKTGPDSWSPSVSLEGDDSSVIFTIGVNTTTTDTTGGNGTNSTTQSTAVLPAPTGFGYVAPYSTAVVINNNAMTTDTAAVTLALTSTDGAYMEISNLPDLSDATWEPYVAAKSWKLTDGDGTKIVYARYKTAAGNITDIVSDSITLQTMPQGQVLGASTSIFSSNSKSDEVKNKLILLQAQLISLLQQLLQMLLSQGQLH